MVKVLINGALGKMGKKVFEACASEDNVVAVCGVDRFCDFSNEKFPVYDSFESVKEDVDVVIDFSAPVTLKGLLDFCLNKNVNAVLCTTGYTEEDLSSIKNASEKVAIFRSANMSLGVNVLIDLVKKATVALAGYDIEIIEKHHNQKVDAPSGTALMLAQAVKEQDENKTFVFGRNGAVGKRDKNEVGIHAVRGGNIVGDHDVLFAGTNETVTISHQAFDRSVFAIGAVRASEYISSKKSGVYNMQNLVNND